MSRCNLTAPYRMSAQNCANTYLEMHCEKEFPHQWPVQPTLSYTHVYDGFIILSLLEDAIGRQTSLKVPSYGLQADRFKSAMSERNLRIRLYGLPDVSHWCTKCVRIYPPSARYRESAFSTYSCMMLTFISSRSHGLPPCHRWECNGILFLLSS